MKNNLSTLSILVAGLFFNCNDQNDKSKSHTSMETQNEQVKITRVLFGNTPEGQADLYTLTNQNGMQVQITNYAGIIVSILAPDKDGTLGEVTHGFDNLEAYLGPHPHFGALIGRYGNRIGGAQFDLNGETYKLAANNGENHLHGGTKGFDKYLWEAKAVTRNDEAGVELKRISPHMEEGYPGNLDVTVTYWLNNDNNLLIDYLATSDQKTICNLTNHAYFNLSNGSDILDHELQIKAEHYTPVDEGLIPTGAITSVAETPFDFRDARLIGEYIDSDHPQMVIGGGYDHNFVLKRDVGGGRMQLAAVVYDKKSGRQMELFTTEPGVQFYTGNFLDGSIIGRGGTAYGKRSAFCLETQHYPDSPNKASFPSVVLEPGATYRTSTSYRFSVR